LEKQIRPLQAALARLETANPSVAPAAAAKARFTGKGMKSLRKRLRLSAAGFARLLGVTGQSVYNWEHSNGPLRLRKATRTAVLKSRGMGAREAKQRLAEMPAAAKKKAAPRKKSGKRK